MCWLDANVTRSPCFARFAASARVPSPMQVRRAEEGDAVGRREPLTRDDLLGDGLQRRIGDARAVEHDGVGHGLLLDSA